MMPNKAWRIFGVMSRKFRFPLETQVKIDFEITNGKIRSSMLVLNPKELLIPIQSNNGSVLIHWKDDVREDHHIMIGSFGIIIIIEVL